MSQFFRNLAEKMFHAGGAIIRKLRRAESLFFRGEYFITVLDGLTGEKREYHITNKIPMTGRTIICNRIFNAVPTSTLLLNYFAVGTGVTAPADGNTQLQTEVARKQQTSRTNAADVGAASTVFAAGEIPGTPITIREVGVFIEGTGTANSGYILSRAAANITVNPLDSLFIDFRLSLSSAT